MKEICILIPTKDRASSINYYMQQKLDLFREYDIDIIICDSSSDNRTRKVIDEFIRKGYSNIFFFRYTDEAKDPYGEKKVCNMLFQLIKDYEYIWISGDTTIIQIERIIDEIKRGIINKYSIIHIYKNNLKLSTKEYTDCRLFFKYFYWSMTHWCSFILSKEFIEKLLIVIENRYVSNSGHMFPQTIFTCIAYDSFKALYINDMLYSVSPYRVNSYGHERKEILENWARKWCLGIDSLPDIYNDQKAYVKISISKNTGLFSMYGVIALRANGNITYSNVKEYSGYIKQVTRTPLFYFRIWSIIPVVIAKKIVEVHSFYVDKLSYAKQKILRIIPK